MPMKSRDNPRPTLLKQFQILNQFRQFTWTSGLVPEHWSGLIWPELVHVKHQKVQVIYLNFVKCAFYNKIR